MVKSTQLQVAGLNAHNSSEQAVASWLLNPLKNHALSKLNLSGGVLKIRCKHSVSGQSLLTSSQTSLTQRIWSYYAPSNLLAYDLVSLPRNMASKIYGNKYGKIAKKYGAYIKDFIVNI